jgi:SAM-dependent methyltransferase
LTDLRTALLQSLLPLRGRGLEIGPGYNPLVPKAEGFQVKTADYTDQEGLRRKYSGTPNVEIERIEPVDHVLDGTRSMADSIGQEAAFDYIVASHVIEHTPDMLDFLKSCQRLLRPSGLLLLAVPDKRFCFDIFQPLTGTGAVLQAHLDRRKAPPPGAIFDDFAYNAVRRGEIGWGPSDPRPLSFFNGLPHAAATYYRAQQATEYIDVHVWRFVPSSFRLIMRDLHDMGELDLAERHFYDTIRNEFFMVLSTSAPGCPVDRLSLAKRAMAEQAAIHIEDV